MRITIATGLAGSLALLASPALAQEVVDDQGFSGIYFGAAGGYDVQPNDVNSGVAFDRNLDGRFGDTVLTGTGANAFGLPNGGSCNGRANGNTSPTNVAQGPGTCRNDSNGYAYYARVGIDSQSGNIVIGAVGEFGRSEINDSVTAFSTTPAAYVFTRSIDWEATIRGRAGYTPNNTTLFYGTFGTGYARIDRSFFSTQSVNTFTGRGKRNQWGITGGGGVEQKIGRNLSIGLEYMHHQYQDDDYRVRATAAGVTPFTNPNNGGVAGGTDFRRTDTQFRWHSVRATVNFRL
jgi:outer membrane immunogenic protein